MLRKKEDRGVESERGVMVSGSTSAAGDAITLVPFIPHENTKRLCANVSRTEVT